jgi:hypothetical protein
MRCANRSSILSKKHILLYHGYLLSECFILCAWSWLKTLSLLYTHSSNNCLPYTSTFSANSCAHVIIVHFGFDLKVIFIRSRPTANHSESVGSLHVESKCRWTLVTFLIHGGLNATYSIFLAEESCNWNISFSFAFNFQSIFRTVASAHTFTEAV